jgi:hypothetical protein
MFGLLQIFYAPGEVFDRVREKGTWFPPILAIILLSIISGAAFSSMVSMNAIIRKQMEANPQTVEKLGPEGIERMSSNPAYQGLWYAGTIAGPLTIVALAGIFLGALSITGGRTTYKQVLGATAYAWFPYALLLTLMSMLIVYFSTGREELNFKNLVGTNVGAFLDPATTSKAWYSIASSLDLLSFGLIGLLSYGLAKVSKMPAGTCAGIVIGIWAIYVLGKAGTASLF